MNATGMVFLSRGGVRLTRDSQGQPTLTLLAVARIANHQVEPWALFWKGADAAQFHAQHSAQLVAGTPLNVTVDNLRAHTAGRTVEITARVLRCELAARQRTDAQRQEAPHAP